MAYTFAYPLPGQYTVCAAQAQIGPSHLGSSRTSTPAVVPLEKQGVDLIALPGSKLRYQTRLGPIRQSECRTRFQCSLNCRILSVCTPCCVLSTYRIDFSHPPNYHRYLRQHTGHTGKGASLLSHSRFQKSNPSVEVSAEAYSCCVGTFCRYSMREAPQQDTHRRQSPACLLQCGT